MEFTRGSMKKFKYCFGLCIIFSMIRNAYPLTSVQCDEIFESNISAMRTIVSSYTGFPNTFSSLMSPLTFTSNKTNNCPVYMFFEELDSNRKDQFYDQNRYFRILYSDTGEYLTTIYCVVDTSQDSTENVQIFSPMLQGLENEQLQYLPEPSLNIDVNILDPIN
jgi:hypothetical protein